MQTPPNAIQQRLKKLEACWSQFTADPNARILRWIVDADSEQLLQLFHDIQNEEISEIPDLFVQFSEPFQDSQSYVEALIESLKSRFSEVQAELSADGIDADWLAPHVSAPADCSDLLSVLSSFQGKFESLMEHLVVVLTPEQVTSQTAWLQWWADLAALKTDSAIRFVVADQLKSPLFGSLADRFPEQVMSVNPELDMPHAWEEIVSGVPGSGPGHDFRKYFVSLTNAANAGNVAQAESAAAQAVLIATQQQWFYLASAAQMALGAAYFVAGNLAAAAQSYRSANEVISGSDDVASKALDVPTRMAEGSALVAAEKYTEAADVFQQAAAAAKSHGDKTSEQECWRMAGWCHETAGQPAEAWECGEKSLLVGETLEVSDRQSSTLPYVGQMMLRLAASGTHRDQKRDIQERMTRLLGQDWTELLVQPTTQPA